MEKGLGESANLDESLLRIGNYRKVFRFLESKPFLLFNPGVRTTRRTLAIFWRYVARAMGAAKKEGRPVGRQIPSLSLLASCTSSAGGARLRPFPKELAPGAFKFTSGTSGLPLSIFLTGSCPLRPFVQSFRRA